jgi:chemotaxis protein methyltransferase CheR
VCSSDLDHGGSGPVAAEDYRAFRDLLEQMSGIVLGDHKEYLLASRLTGLLRDYRLESLKALLTGLRSGDGRLRTAVVDAMTTNETFWFRDVAHFRILAERVLAEAKPRIGQPLRIWSAACSSGQEPYSLSMTVQDFLLRNPGRLPAGVEILATDISSKVLAEARAGEYCGVALSRGLEAAQRRQFFLPKGECLEVRPEIRRRVSFRELNLASSYALLGRFDVIFCRNVLIYFSAALKGDILNRMAQCLNPGGHLFLGSTESLTGHTDRFEMLTACGGIAYRLRPR